MTYYMVTPISGGGKGAFPSEEHAADVRDVLNERYETEYHVVEEEEASLSEIASAVVVAAAEDI